MTFNVGDTILQKPAATKAQKSKLNTTLHGSCFSPPNDLSSDFGQSSDQYTLDK
jgi:hypothetical protein